MSSQQEPPAAAPIISQPEPPANLLSALGEFIRSLFVLGGVPLVFIGVGTANLFLPNTGGYSSQEQLFVTGFLFLAGLVGWVFGTFLTYRLKVKIIDAYIPILQLDKDTSVITARLNNLRALAGDLGIRRLPQLVPPDTDN